MSTEDRVVSQETQVYDRITDEAIVKEEPSVTAEPDVTAEPAGDKKPGALKRFGRWVMSWKLWVKIVVLVGILALVTGGVLAVTAYRSMEDIVEVMNKDAEIPEDYDLSLQPVDGFINILLLGVDTRDMDEIKGSRSDMIMIASINAETSEVTLTSVFRDTYLKLGDTPTYDKITHACVYGGPEMTIKSLNQALDLNIEQYVIVNFKAVADVVDAVGGITVDVQENEIEQLNKYTKETARAIGKKKKEYHLVEEPGIQTLEGVQAVSYGRIRKGVGDDYKRTERMRTVVNLVFQKLKNRSFSKLKEIINIVVPQCRTNLKLNDILALGKDITKYSISSGSGFPYTVGNKTLNGVSYVFPANLGESVMQLHRDVFGQEDYILSDTASAISNEIYRRFISASGSNAVVDINDLEYNQQSSTQSQTTTADQTSANLGTTQQNPSQTQTTTITSTSTSDTTAGESSDSGGSKSDSSKTDSKSDSSKSESSDSGKTDSSKTDSSKSDSGKSESGKSDSGKSDSSKTDSGDSSQTTQPAQVTEPEPEPQPEPEPEPEPEPTPEPEPEPEPTPDPGPSDGGGDSDTSGEG